MANEGHIFIKGSKKSAPTGMAGMKKTFFMPVDRGSARPAFCYPKHREFMSDEVNSMQKALDNGMVAPDRRMQVEHDLIKHRERLDQINESWDNAEKVIKANPDYWAARREQLASEISDAVPSRKDVKERRVNPHKNLNLEKQGGLEEKKNEFRIISRAMQAAGMDAESNVAFLQKEK